MFEIAIGIFLFKRTSGLEKIFGQLRKIKPIKIYLIADGPRSAEEKEACMICRKKAESLIDWDCEIKRNYSDENRGVYNNIGNGAKWVFEHEKCAIFLEDDNYPEITFFEYCKQLLAKYEYNEKILWICGTNYYDTMDLETSYVFTKHLLPCGWASWSDKFVEYYDGLLEGLSNPNKCDAFKKSYLDPTLYRQQWNSISQTKYLLDLDVKKSSWDYQMLFSIRSNDLYGIAPKNNQIRNIGADAYSIHGGNSMRKEMTKRFCSVPTVPLEFPLIDPMTVEINEQFEKQIGKVLLYPLADRIKVKVGKIIKKVLHINQNKSLTIWIREKQYKYFGGKN